MSAKVAFGAAKQPISSATAVFAREKNSGAYAPEPSHRQPFNVGTTAKNSSGSSLSLRKECALPSGQ